MASLLTSFADDTTISRPITSIEEVSGLQQDLEAVYAWATTSNMQFNEEKFKLLRHGHNQEIKERAKLYSEGGVEITATSHVICLGVQFSEDCSFQYHISEAVKKAKMMAGWILRTFSSREQETLLTL